MSIIWSEQIDSILNCGVSLDCMGIKNWALARDGAISAIKELEFIGVPILGGDVYLLVDGGAEQTYDSWYFNQEIGEPSSVFLKRSSDRARSYISNYPVNGVLFSIVPRV